jgi:DNA-binding winged helix-turn-helix (wHTH) protein/TolB-like protein
VPASPDYYEFGPFRLEVASRSLYRAGAYVPVTPKAFDTLRVLVEEAGHVVTKEELLRRVWPDAFVEEGSIANNISMLRKILNPHYGGDGPIATIARRGYRFTAPVTLRNATPGIAVIAESGPLDAAVLKAIEEHDEATDFASDAIRRGGSSDAPAETGRGASSDPVAAEGTSVRAAVWTRPALCASLGFVLLAILGALGMIRATISEARADSRPVRRAVAVLSMKNLSGRDEVRWISTALAESINAELGAGGQLRLISGAAVAQMQQDLAPQPGVGLSRRQLDEIGRNLGADLILTGSYTNHGGRVTVDMRLDDISTGAPVTSLSLSEDEKKLQDLVAVASRELRSKLGLTPPMAGQTASARAALSSNPDALRYYFVGLEALRIHDVSRSTELLTQATIEDPGFALAHSVLSIAWRVLGHDGKSHEEAKKAFALAGKLSREDQLAVEGAYYEVMSDSPKAIEKYQALWNFFPDNIAYALKLVHQQMLAGRRDEARRTIDQMRALAPPADTDPRVDQVEAEWFFRQGRYADVLITARKGAAHARLRKSNQLLATALLTQGRAQLRLGDVNQARSLLAGARQLYDQLGDQAGVAQAMRTEALVLSTRGELAGSKTLLDESLRIATKLNHQRLVPEILVMRANVNGQLNQLAAAKADAETALVALRASNNHAGLARALTALGDVETQQRDYTTARVHLEEAERLGRTIGEPPVFAAAASALAKLEIAEGRVAMSR